MRQILLFVILSFSLLRGAFNDFAPLLPFPFHAFNLMPSEGLSVLWQLSNHYVKRLEGDNAFVYDYEMISIRPRFDFQLETFRCSLALPLYLISGGFMDEFISNWHQWWGFPDAGRIDDGFNLVQQQFAVGGKNGQHFNQAYAGVGDLQFQLTQNIPKTILQTCYLLTLPSTSLNFGSDSVAWGAGLQAPLNQNLAMRIFVYGGGGNAFTRTLDRRMSFQVDTEATLDILGLQSFHRITYLVSPYRNTGIPELDIPGLIYVIGLQVNPNLLLTFQEDLSLSNAPDFTISCQWSP